MLIYAVHMLLYKLNAHWCIGLWSLQVCIRLLNVSVLPLLELDFKHLFYSDGAGYKWVDKCFETTSGRCCFYFQVPFSRCFEIKRLPSLNQIPVNAVNSWIIDDKSAFTMTLTKGIAAYSFEPKIEKHSTPQSTNECPEFPTSTGVFSHFL